MRLLIPLALAALAILTPGVAPADQPTARIVVEGVATPQQVDALDERLRALSAEVAARLSAIEGRVADLEAGSTQDPGDGDPGPVDMTDNRRAIEAFVAPFLPLAEPSPERVVTCGYSADKTVYWPCVHDEKLSDYAGMAGAEHHFTTLQQADNACRMRPGVCRGVAVLPGIHDARRVARAVTSRGETLWNHVRNVTFAADGTTPSPFMHVRAQNKDRQTVFDCRANWGSGGDFCISSRGGFTVKFEGIDCWGNGRGSQNNACYGAESKQRSGLILVDLTVSGVDNCVRTGGMPILLNNVTLDGCGLTGQAHGIYASGDARRGVFCTLFVMVDSRSINNKVGSAVKSRCAVNYLRNNDLHAPNGFCVDVATGGAALLVDNRCDKGSGRTNQGLAVVHGLDKATLPTGAPRADKGLQDRNLADWCRFGAVYLQPQVRNRDPLPADYPDTRAIALGRMTIVDLEIVHDRRGSGGNPLGVGVWANPYIQRDGTGEDGAPVCRPPHEYHNITVQRPGETAAALTPAGPWRQR